MPDYLIVAFLGFFGTIIGALIGAIAAVRVARISHSQPETGAIATRVSGPADRDAMEPRASSRKPSYWLASASHVFLGCGLFYLRSSGWRRWVYPLFPIYAVLDYVLGVIVGKDPFRTNEFGATTFGISVALFAVSFLDIVFVCRAQRKRFHETNVPGPPD